MPVRILMVHNRYQHRGGEDSVVEDEIRILEANGHEVRLYERDNQDIESQSRIRSFTQTIWSQRTLCDLEEIQHNFQPQVIHAHNTFPLISPAVYWFANKKNIPLVQTLHNFRLFCLQAMFLRNGRVCEDCLGHLPWRGVTRACYRDSRLQSAATAAMLITHRAMGTYHHMVSRYIALNNFCREVFIRGGLPADKIVIKPNFVNLPGEAATHRCGNPLFVGRLSAEKGIVVLTEAMTGKQGYKLDIVGSGPLEDKLTAHDMVLHGAMPAEEVYGMMRRAPFLVMPSIWYENFPRTLVEAFACTLPVIASRIGAFEELIDEGVTGLLFEPGSAHDLRQKMDWAIEHPGEMSDMGRNARKRYEKCYTPDVNYRTLMDIYRDVMA